MGISEHDSPPHPAETVSLAVRQASAVTQPAMAESASTMLAAQARAAVEARYLVAMRQPRSWETVRVKLLGACDRLYFANRAIYSKPVGGKQIKGPSIRFAEEALRCMGNVLVETMVVQEDREQRIVRVSVTDLEANLSYPQDNVVRKEVERSHVKSGQTIISQRLNSEGKPVYLVPATDDDLLVKQNAIVSKSMRTSGLRILPSDILEECMDQCRVTVEKNDAKDPEATKKRMVDAFAARGVMPTDIEAWLGHPIAQITKDERKELSEIANAMNEGEANWPDIMDARWAALSASKSVAAKTNARATELKEKIKKAGAKSEPGKPAETEEERIRREDAEMAASGGAPMREPGDD